MKILIASLAALLLSGAALSQERVSARIVVLPLSSNGIDAVTIETSESLLRTEIGKLSSMDIVSGRKTKEAVGDTPCTESECAVSIGRTLNATQVLGCRLSALGEKIIVQYFLVDVPTGKQILIDQATALSADDLEVLMKRLAKSVVEREPIAKGAEVGTILSSEGEEPMMRATRKNLGLSFGYLYPTEGYDNSERQFIVDARLDYEIEDYAVGMLVGIRDGFAMNLYGSYLTSRGDLCPYVGASTGFHWVSHDAIRDPVTYERKELRSDGFEIGAMTGIRVLHTYNFQMIFNLEFILTMNEYNDKAIVFTIGLL